MFNSDFDSTSQGQQRYEDYNKYSSITQENIDAQLAKVLPPQEVQMAIQQGDMQAMALMNGHNQHMMMQNQSNNK